MSSENDGMYVNELIKDFYNRIINTVSFNNFENLSIEWIMNTLKHNDMDAKIFLELIQNHENCFSSLIGFFYQHGLGCNVNRDKALEMYLLAIKHDEVQSINNIIAKYLLSLYYYKDIILVNKISIGKPLRNRILISQFVNPNESRIKDDDKNKELQDESNNSDNYDQESKKKMNKSNNNVSDFNCRYEIEINSDEKTFVQYAISARGGNIIAQYNLAYCYQYGKGISRDEKKAFEWYLKSAEAGNNAAQCNLGYCYQYGKGVNKDEKEAFEWYLLSAETGNSTAQSNLGYCYQYGIGANQDEKKAFEWYLVSNEVGNNAAQCNLGYCYQYGIGTNEDKKKAFEWYLESAETGNSSAQNNLGRCYELEIGTIKDENKAFEWYLKSAKNGNPNS